MIFYIFCLIIFSQDNSEKKIINLNMSKAITMMLNQNNNIKAQNTRLFLAKNKIREAKSYIYPSLDAFINLAPTPKITGNLYESQKDWGTWGSSLKFGAKLVQPLYTFGLIDSYMDAATNNFDLEQSKLDLKKSELILLTKKYYYSFQLANDLADIVEDGKKKFDEALKVSDDLLIKKKIKKDDIYQLKMSYSVFMDKYLEAYRKKDLALLGLKWLLAIDFDTEIEFEENSIIPEELDLESENTYINLSNSNRPEYKMIDSGLRALNSLISVQKHKRYPVFYTALLGSVARSNVIDDQASMFADDPYNNMGGALMLGFKINLDWWRNDPLINQAKAEYDFLKFEKEYKTQGMKLEIKKFYREALDSKKSLDFAMQGEKNATKWNFNATLAYSLGNIKSKEMLDAIKGVLESKLYFNMAIYNYNMAIASLSKICDTELVKEFKY